MSVFKCKMCGGTIEFAQGTTVGTCECCGTRQTLPRLDDDRRTNLYDRANHFRRNNEFDKAAGIYEQILNEDTGDAEAYWSLVLCRYGIEYVDDPATHKRVPTVNRAQFTSIFDDDNYKSALQYADSYQRIIYEQEANTINEIQKGILSISQKEAPFDVFICYKETDNYGKRTYDSVLANDLYYQLTQEGFNVFFARITLEDKLGSAYEPYIFAALNSAKVMVVLGTKPEYFNAPWVRNEWSRYLTLVRESGGKKTLIPAYRDMDPYDLPEEFSHLQAQDMSKLGFMQDLIRGIKKIARADEPKQVVKETVVMGGNAKIEPLLKRAFLFLEDCNWSEADAYCEKVLDQDPENSQAYLGKLMVELRVRRKEDLANYQQPFDFSSNYQKAVRFGDKALASELGGYISKINERKENERLSGIYNAAVKAMNAANSETRFIAVHKTFQTISGFKDADSLAQQCLERAEISRKNEIYASAKAKMAANTIEGYESAIRIFSTISGWHDSDQQMRVCQSRIEEIRLREEQARLERERITAERQIAAARAKKRNKRILLSAAAVAVVCIVFVVLLVSVFIPNHKLSEAKKLVKSGNYEEGYARLEELGKSDLVAASKYERAVALMDSGDYEGAISLFEGLRYKDSESLIEECEAAIKDDRYAKAINLLKAENYDEAYAILEELGKSDVISENKYERAITLMGSKKYSEAIALLSGLNYKDSESLITKCRSEIKDDRYAQAKALLASGDYDAAYAILSELGKHDEITESKYNRALALMNSGKYSQARTLFTEAGTGYKDSANKIEECICKSQMAGIKMKAGSTFKFGYYEQDNDTANGKEEIEWIVLKIKDNKALVISKYVLDYQPYHSSYSDVTWEKCSLRKWLNNTFYNNAFNSYHKQAIAKSTVETAKNKEYPDSKYGKKTTDKVYLISATALNNYFKTEAARKCQETKYCEYLKKQNFYYEDAWWTRTPGQYDDHIVSVYESGYVYTAGDRVSSSRGVRPVMWINLSN